MTAAVALMADTDHLPDDTLKTALIEAAASLRRRGAAFPSSDETKFDRAASFPSPWELERFLRSAATT
jgi:hypothetical protein